MATPTRAGSDMPTSMSDIFHVVGQIEPSGWSQLDMARKVNAMTESPSLELDVLELRTFLVLQDLDANWRRVDAMDALKVEFH